MGVFGMLGGLNVVLFIYFILPWQAFFFLCMATMFICLEMKFRIHEFRYNGLLHYCPAMLKLWFVDYSPLEFLTDPFVADYISLYLPFMLNPNEQELKRALKRLPYDQQHLLLQRRVVDILPNKTRTLFIGTKNIKKPKVRVSKNVEEFLKYSKTDEMIKMNRVKNQTGKKYVFDVSEPEDPTLTMDILFHNKYYAILDNLMQSSGANNISNNSLISMSTILTTVSLYLNYYRNRNDSMIKTLIRYLLSFGSLSSLVAVYLKFKGLSESSNKTKKKLILNSRYNKSSELKGFKLFKKFIHGLK